MVDEFGEPFQRQRQDAREAMADVRALRAELNLANDIGRAFGRTLTTVFTDAARGGKRLGDILRDAVRQLSQNTLRAALGALQNQVSRGVSSLLKGAFGFAHGGALRRGMPVPFADGGVVSAPVAFPMAGGRLGVAGEAGPEAILPLSRGTDGRLGVRAEGASRPVAVTFNVTSPDAESFRRSESQITAMLNRAVSRGERNL